MAVVTIDEKEFEVDDAVAAELARLQEGNTDQEGEEEEEEEQADSETPEPAADAEGGGTPAPAPAGSPEAAPPQTSGTPTGLSATVSVSSGKADGYSKLLSRLDGLEDRVAAKLDAKAKTRQDAKVKAKHASEKAYADARGALAKSYDPEGKSASTIMRDAIVARNPDLKAKADAAIKQPQRLRGMFDAEMAHAPHPDTHPLGDVVPETSEKQDAWQKRVDANRNARQTHRVLGNEAMRQTAAGAN